MAEVNQNPSEPIAFKAETRQLLNILIHSLYTEKEVFIRELISNAADALTRLNFEMLTNREIIDPEAELGIWISWNEQDNTLCIRDSGIGMTSDELSKNLGTIAHSGAKAFIEAVENDKSHISEIIGQFGVGFYSAFMAADWVRVTSRSYKPGSTANTWFSEGQDTFTLEPADFQERGTLVTIKLKDNAKEFCKESRLREVVQKHSDYIPFPIYLGEGKEQANKQNAIWRQPPQKVEKNEYEEFYKQFTLDWESPITHLHLSVDAPVQLYALLYIPASIGKNVFSSRREEGLRLYARKILIQDYSKDLLPNFLQFIQGVVDSEDLPLNVSRESVQSNRFIAQMKKLLTTKVIDLLKNMALNQTDEYLKFWKTYGRFIQEGVALDPDYSEKLYPLLRFESLNKPGELISLDQYLVDKKVTQDKIFYILGDDPRAIQHSPHLEPFRKHGYDVLLMSDPVSSFVLLRLNKYKDAELVNVSSEAVKLPEIEENESDKERDTDSQASNDVLIILFKEHLGDKVSEVRITNRLVESPARLVDKEGSTSAELQKVYKYLNRDFQIPQKILEINPEHLILQAMKKRPDNDPLVRDVIDQVYENALLIEGLHPDPVSMISRIQTFIMNSLE